MEKILNLGCGLAKIPGAVNVDSRSLGEPDVLWDLDNFPYPWEDSSFDKIIMSHILEHLDDVSAVLLECDRLLRWGGTLEISVPHCSHDVAWGDRFHKRIVNDYTVISGSIVSTEDIEEMRTFSLTLIQSITRFDKKFKWMLYMPKWVKDFAIYHLRNVARESFYILQKVAKFTTITFDDGPSEYTPAVLDKLAELKIKATFFVLGINAEKYPDIIKRIVDEGHNIGIHGYDHRKWITREIVEYEVARTKEILAKIMPDYNIDYFRPPFLRGFAEKYPLMVKVPSLKGLCSVDYSTICNDWKPETTLKQMLIFTKAHLIKGGTILFHDGYYDEQPYKDRSKASQVLYPLLIYLIARGYRIVDLKTLEGLDGKTNRAAELSKMGQRNLCKV